jgi:hypothetical protein
MTMDDEPTEQYRTPGLEVSYTLFRRWQKARRGTVPAEDMTNPVWEWLFRGRIDPYHANELFKGRAPQFLGTPDVPNEPRWAGCRMGQSRTELSDGRVFWIAGEHEDYYDPDFFIYNDVIIEYPHRELKVIGYPVETFRPTDFHSATATPSEDAILIMESFGNQPGWIHKHHAALSEDGLSIVVHGGEVLTSAGFVENIDEWSLSLADFRWSRLTMRKWPRFQVARADGMRQHLFDYETLEFHQQFPGIGGHDEDSLASELGAEPNMAAFQSLYTPSIKHEVVSLNPESDNAWRSRRILMRGVIVRFTEDMNCLTVTVEGDLDRSTVEAIAMEMQQKLELVEHADCRLIWIS